MECVCARVCGEEGGVMETKKVVEGWEGSEFWHHHFRYSPAGYVKGSACQLTLLNFFPSSLSHIGIRLVPHTHTHTRGLARGLSRTQLVWVTLHTVCGPFLHVWCGLLCNCESRSRRFVSIWLLWHTCRGFFLHLFFFFRWWGLKRIQRGWVCEIQKGGG